MSTPYFAKTCAVAAALVAFATGNAAAAQTLAVRSCAELATDGSAPSTDAEVEAAREEVKLAQLALDAKEAHRALQETAVSAALAAPPTPRPTRPSSPRETLSRRLRTSGTTRTSVSRRRRLR